MVPGSSGSLCWTLPDKIRQGEVSNIQPTFSVVSSHRLDLPHHGFDHTWRDNNTYLVIKQDILVAVPVAWSRDLADGVQRTRYVCKTPSAIYLAVGARQ